MFAFSEQGCECSLARSRPIPRLCLKFEVARQASSPSLCASVRAVLCAEPHAAAGCLQGSGATLTACTCLCLLSPPLVRRNMPKFTFSHPTGRSSVRAVAQECGPFCWHAGRGELICLCLLPAQDMWARANEDVTLHCDVRFATCPDLPVTWMFAKDVSCTCVCTGIHIYS